MSPDEKKRSFFSFLRKPFWAAMLFAAAIMFLNLGSEGIYAAQEGRTAIITCNMLRSGNFMDMVVEHGIPYEKPVGHYWLCLLPAKLCGIDGDPLRSAAEWGLRLPSALAAMLCCLFCGLLAKRIYGEREGAASIVMLSSMATFATLGRLAHIDMLLACATTGAMYFFYTGYLEKKFRHPEREEKAGLSIYGFYLMLAAGMLLKGPLPVLLAGLCVLLCMFVYRDWKMPLRLRPFSGGALFLLTALPWYVAETIRTGGAFFEEFIVNQNLRRFTGIGSTYRDGERMSLFYYFPKMFAGMLPWSIAGAAAVAAYAKKIFRRNLHLRKETIFLLVWFWGWFVFFSFSALKRGDYVLGLYPAGAILIARAAVMFFDRAPKLWSKWRTVFRGLCGLLLAALCVNLSGVLVTVGEKVASREWTFMSKRDGMTMAMISAFVNEHLVLAFASAAVLMLLLYGFFRFWERRELAKSFVLVSLLVLTLFSAYHGVIQPGTDRNKTVKPFVPEIRKHLSENETILYIGDFNTELIFFVDHPYDVKMNDEARYIVSGEESLFPLLSTDEWEMIACTGKDHQYPAYLLRRISRTTAP